MQAHNKDDKESKNEEEEEETNHMSSGTSGSSRRKASRQVYKERGSVRAFLLGGPLNTSGKFSR